MEAIRTALQSRIPEMKQNFIDTVRSRYEWFTKTYGEMIDVPSQHYQSYVQYQQIRDMLSKIWKETGEKVSCYNPSSDKDRIKTVINEERLDRKAQEYAEAVVMNWYNKIVAKLQNLESAEVKYLTGHRFTITGVRNGKKICIEQDMIIKSSPRGLLFNQFPARIYVDGKFTPEAQYKKMF